MSAYQWLANIYTAAVVPTVPLAACLKLNSKLCPLIELKKNNDSVLHGPFYNMPEAVLESSLILNNGCFLQRHIMQMGTQCFLLNQVFVGRVVSARREFLSRGCGAGRRVQVQPLL